VKLNPFHALIFVGASILVDAPVHRVYEQWTRIEEFPKYFKVFIESHSESKNAPTNS